MPIEFEPIQWESDCGMFYIMLTPINHAPYHATDEREGNKGQSGKFCKTFDDARQWCEERAKQGQGGGE